MPLFVVSCTDHDGTVEKRLATRPEHLARLQQLNDQGRLIVAGAMPKDPTNPQAGFYGSTIIVDLQPAKLWISGSKMNPSYAKVSMPILM